jgi:hypothetical protein
MYYKNYYIFNDNKIFKMESFSNSKNKKFNEKNGSLKLKIKEIMEMFFTCNNIERWKNNENTDIFYNKFK